MLPSSRPFNQHYCCSSSSNSACSNSDIAAESASAVAYGLGMDSIQLPVASVEVLRCMRCACSVEATSTDDIGAMGMVRIAYNLYYCKRCAKITGLGQGCGSAAAHGRWHQAVVDAEGGRTRQKSRWPGVPRSG
ncbi:hypothetical protein FOXB_15515 [Fusarium oxysporum f. sp. conglutinans Fo5176]|uniref:Uncharacterized protein n=1 Tax=Fusarium oxysporum (strain Fo5176) TaxID=660025 RepID=F9GA33_FUSOF|nr:hypothetical protein FOXB_15515 [Fusarium oxysporum f. sp. conglutinans Fo5176]KAI8401248.1 hypothetical protein FOFC_18117 [Fusarium oxysporum]